MVEQHSPTTHSRARPFQFSLRQLLVSLFVMCTFLGAYASLRIPGVALVLFAGSLGATVMGVVRRNYLIAFGPITLIFLIYLLLPDLSLPPEVVRRSACGSNLKQIGLALHNYFDQYGSFPPPLVADEKGRPMHSWRVLILPFLEEQALYDQYDFSEPWDGPNNSLLAGKMPDVFCCPSDRAARTAGTTNYFAVVDPEIGWGNLALITPNTIIVVEVDGAKVGWLEPRDLNLTKLSPVINSKETKGISSRHAKGANVLMASGWVQFLTNDMLPENVRELLAPQADEK